MEYNTTQRSPRAAVISEVAGSAISIGIPIDITSSIRPHCRISRVCAFGFIKRCHGKYAISAPGVPAGKYDTVMKSKSPEHARHRAARAKPYHYHMMMLGEHFLSGIALLRESSNQRE